MMHGSIESQRRKGLNNIFITKYWICNCKVCLSVVLAHFLTLTSFNTCANVTFIIIVRKWSILFHFPTCFQNRYNVAFPFPLLQLLFSRFGRCGSKFINSSKNFTWIPDQIGSRQILMLQVFVQT